MMAACGLDDVGVPRHPESIPGSEEAMVTSLCHRLRLLGGWEGREEKRGSGGRGGKRQPHTEAQRGGKRARCCQSGPRTLRPNTSSLPPPPSQGLGRDLWDSSLTVLFLHRFLIWKEWGHTVLGTLEPRMNVYQRLRD